MVAFSNSSILTSEFSFLLVHICSKSLTKDDVVDFTGQMLNFSFSFFCNFWSGMHLHLQVSFLVRCTSLLVDDEDVQVVDFVCRAPFSVLATFFLRYFLLGVRLESSAMIGIFFCLLGF